MGEDAQTDEGSERPDVSVYWMPGCSSCLKLKEFVEEQGIAFESVNLLAQQDRIDEVLAAGLRSGPAIRKGDRIIHGQNLDDVAALLGVSRHHRRLPHAELIERWDEILQRARDVVRWFPEDQLWRRAILIRERPIKDLCTHVFQIPETFLLQLHDRLETDLRTALGGPKDEIVTRDDLIAYIDRIIAEFEDWKATEGERSIPSRMMTYYGEQASGPALERMVWHSAQHARQLDTIAAGLGAEFQIPVQLYQGLPMPQRLWA